MNRHGIPVGGWQATVNHEAAPQIDWLRGEDSPMCDESASRGLALA
ncbi:MAG: hypothetical protein R5N71_02945 [Cutibacterium granulosum]|nr:hypothetical protein [Cutibacterium granulosum]MDU6339256.1 hypothetical protein [Cutibacterium granulosum]MEA5635294.1 hypothetical protein [Cutibacterium granulosum]MEA5648407.1 hypothetical protein [Cutibacterium granulosum]MEA5650772.1 hypothetical protein [Cutibacterium granulosum]MEA5654728.1 hypothetical protein [Cutibacterium granulosum]